MVRRVPLVDRYVDRGLSGWAGANDASVRLTMWNL
jgi:hypothetical protein